MANDHDNTEIRAQVEALSQAVMLLDAAEGAELEEFCRRLSAVEAWARNAGEGTLAHAIVALAAMLRTAGGQGVSESGKTLELASQLVTLLQGVVLHGRGVEEMEMPEALKDPSGDEPRDGSAAGPPVVLPSHVDEKIFSDFLENQDGVLERMEGTILDLEKDAGDGPLKELLGLIHTLKGEAGLLGLNEVGGLCHGVEDALERTPATELTEELLTVKDWLQQTFRFFAGKGDRPGPAEDVLGAFAEAGTSKDEDAGAPEDEANPAPAVEASEASESDAPPDDDALSFSEDPELLADFVNESTEHLEAADVHLLTLETEPAEEEALNAIFRAFHTIKGVAGFLELEQIQHLSHEAENVLDQARKGELQMAGTVIDLIFDSVDLLKRLIGGVRDSIASGKGMVREPGVGPLIQRLGDAISDKLSAEPIEQSDGPSQRLGETLIEAGDATAQDVAEALEKQEAPAEARRVGELLVERALISSRDLEEALEAQAARGGEPPIGQILIEADKITAQDLESALNKQSLGPQKPKLGEILVREGKTPAKKVAQALRRQPGAGEAAPQGVKVKETIKVDAGRLDMLVDTIGELVIAESMVAQRASLDQGTKSSQEDLMRLIGHLDKITRELQEMGMSLRMVPVRSTFQRMARLARDVAKKTGKKINFVTVGEDTELDKTVVDKISDPLVHMIRNSVDHGIEPDAEDRVAAGKPREGRVELRAFHRGSNIYIEIEDDGRGLNRERILAKARERGLIGPEEDLSDREISGLILEPGFSTAEVVSDVSGRGVGLDVVKRSIEALRGKIEIDSTPGKGTIFSIRLPLTLAIIDGMIVKVGRERYIIPTLSITRLIRPKREDFSSVFDKAEMLTVEGRLVPLFRLHQIFDLQGAQEDPTEALVVVVEYDGKQAALLADDTLGQQQIVIKSLGEMFHGIPGVTGGAILPDGKVGIILDVGGLVKFMSVKGKGGAAPKGACGRRRRRAPRRARNPSNQDILPNEGKKEDAAMSVQQGDLSVVDPGGGAGVVRNDLAGKYLTFMLADEDYGLEILKVREIIGLMGITVVPRTPAYIRGVINLRGKVIPVVDLRLKFGMESAEDTEETCIIVVDVPRAGDVVQMGIIVDSVSEVLDISGENIEDTPSFGGDFDATFILGMAKAKDSVKILLHIEAVLNAADLVDIARASAPVKGEEA